MAAGKDKSKHLEHLWKDVSTTSFMRLHDEPQKFPMYNYAFDHFPNFVMEDKDQTPPPLLRRNSLPDLKRHPVFIKSSPSYCTLPEPPPSENNSEGRMVKTKKRKRCCSRPPWWALVNTGLTLFLMAVTITTVLMVHFQGRDVSISPQKLDDKHPEYGILEPKPPKKGKFLMEVDLPPGVDGRQWIDDLAWESDRHLLACKSFGKSLWRITINTTTRETVKTEALYEGISCDCVATKTDGTWAMVTEDHIKLHQPGSNTAEEWRPVEVPKPWDLLFTETEMAIVPSRSSRVYIYGVNRELKRNFTIDWDENEIERISVSKNKFVSTMTFDHHFIIYTPNNGRIQRYGGWGVSDGKFNRPAGVETDPNGYILMCDRFNNRVSVFTHTGAFLHQLDLDVGDMLRQWSIALLPQKGKPPLLALAVFKIRIYELY